MLDAYRDLIDELLGAPAAIKARPPADAAALARLRELIEADRNTLLAVQQMTREETPLLRPAREPLPEPSDAAALVAAFDTTRGELVSLLMNLTLKDWESTGIDQAGAEVTVADIVERHVELDEETRAALGVAEGQ